MGVHLGGDRHSWVSHTALPGLYWFPQELHQTMVMSCRAAVRQGRMQCCRMEAHRASHKGQHSGCQGRDKGRKEHCQGEERSQPARIYHAWMEES